MTPARPLFHSSKVMSAVHCRSFSGYKDELAWGAMWLHKATGEQAYLAKAEESLHNGVAWALSWDDKNVGAQVGTTELSDDSLLPVVVVLILSVPS